MKVLCPAKINLFLNILNKDEGRKMHKIKLVNQTIDLYDELIIKKNNTNEIKIITNADIPKDEKNSVYKASKLFLDYSNINTGVVIEIKKNIPLESGLGGESSDAAGTLLGLNKMFDTQLSIEQLINLGIQIGSDVPYFICSGYKMVKGFGELIEEPKKNNPFSKYIIIKPNFGLNTKDMFQKVDKYPFKEKEFNGELYNDFMKVVPDEIFKLNQFLDNHNIKNHSLSGSGSSYFIAMKEDDNNLINKIKEFNSNYQIFLCNNSSGFQLTK